MSWAALAVAGGADPALEAALAEREAGLAPGDAVNIQYTSGTTGSPKAATLSHRNIVNNGFFIARTCRYTSADRCAAPPTVRLLLPLPLPAACSCACRREPPTDSPLLVPCSVCIPVPLYHCFGMVIGNLAAVCSGAAIVYPAESFNPAATLEAVAAEACTSLLGVPTMFIAELALPKCAWHAAICSACCAYCTSLAARPCMLSIHALPHSALAASRITCSAACGRA